MKFRVTISRRASRDVDRLEDWLIDKQPSAAVRVGEILFGAIGSLLEMPAQGRPAGADSRELDVKFGSDWYVIRFTIIGERVVVTRIFHGRERR